MKPVPEAVFEPSDMTPMIDVVFQLLIFFMLTMQFQEVEAKLLSQLPKHGLASGPSLPREEVRLAVRKDRVFVEKHEIGRLASSETAPERAGENRTVYAAAAERARGLLDVLGPGPVSLVLDADGETAYEHVIGLIDACKGRKIEAIEFTGNPKFERHYR